MKIFKLIVSIIFFIYPLNIVSADSVEEIIKGRKAMFSENYQNGKKISTLLKSKKNRRSKASNEKNI